MRTIILDQFEFDCPQSEEGLELSIATKGDYAARNVLAFVTAVWGSSAKTPPTPVPFAEQLGPGNIRDYLERYAALTLPLPCRWPTYVLSNDWNDWDVVLAGPSIFIRYHWWTTA